MKYTHETTKYTTEEKMLNKFRIMTIGLLMVGALAATPASAQQRSVGCTQDATGTGGGGGGAASPGQVNRSDSDAVVVGVLAVALQNVNVLDNINALITDAVDVQGLNLQVVCLNDVLNQNDIRLLNDLLQGADILNDLTVNITDNQIIQDVLNENDIAIQDVELITVNLLSGEVNVLTQ